MSRTDGIVPSSPPACSTSSEAPRKPIKPPTVTPRRFKKFFTPTSALKVQQNVRTSRRALQDITNPPGKRSYPHQVLKGSSHRDDLENISCLPKESRGSKRKLSFVTDEPSLLSSPLRPDAFFLPSSQGDYPHSLSSRRGSAEPKSSQSFESDSENVAEDEEDELATRSEEGPCVQRFNTLSKSTYILSKRLSGRIKQKVPVASKTWLYETASFYTKPEDTHFSLDPTQAHQVLPFCSATCNSNPLLAVGDEQGGIRLLDSASHMVDGFSKAYLTFKPHDNAIMDLEFSNDDRLLATGSGDQTCRIIDMLTQETIQTLSGHSSSVKRVTFQPESRNSIVASCSRDGTVNIWDLRTRSVDGPAQQLCRAPNADAENQARDFKRPAVLLRDSIRAAHSDGDRSRNGTAPKSKSNCRREDASITSLLFLGAGRQHLLATSSEADASVKLWDMRTTYNTRRARPLPISTTRQPDNHESHRRFGLTSMALSSDSSRLYTLCRDNTIYAYSSSHLILGGATEMTTTSLRPRRAGGAERDGLGPMYGFRHQKLQVSTFYVKLSIRKQKDDQAELLATGSGNECAVLFPTNERYLRTQCSSRSTLGQIPSTSRRSESGIESAPSSKDDIPIFHHGTALVRGHRKEVTSISWTSEGNLVTASDDFSIRCWREGEEARSLRTGGEGQGKRWMSGWAEVGGDGEVDSSYDDNDAE